MINHKIAQINKAIRTLHLCLFCTFPSPANKRQYIQCAFLKINILCKECIKLQEFYMGDSSLVTFDEIDHVDENYVRDRL